MVQDTCEKLDYVPAKVRALRHVRFKYAYKACDDNGPRVTVAPVPLQLIERSMASKGLFPYIIVSKFANASPLYHQLKSFARLGIELFHATMVN